MVRTSSARLLLTVTLALVATACGQGGAGQSSTATASPGGAASPSPSAAASGPPRFTADTQRITSRAAVKHSWKPGCPVPLSGLRKIRMSYWGFDDKAHTGELVVNEDAAKDVVRVFRKLYTARYPIRRMEPVDKYRGSDYDSIEADNTSAFNCRRATGSSGWSQHAYGRAIDLNPCENPYVSESGHVSHKDCVKYKNRRLRAPGMVHKGDRTVRTFSEVGWSWGGTWSGARDYQHFSSSGG